MSDYSELVKRLSEEAAFHGCKCLESEAAQAIERLATSELAAQQSAQHWKEQRDRELQLSEKAERELAEARAEIERRDAIIDLAIKELCHWCAEGVPTDKTWQCGDKDRIDRKGLYHPNIKGPGQYGGGYFKCNAATVRQALAAPAPAQHREATMTPEEREQEALSFATDQLLEAIAKPIKGAIAQSRGFVRAQARREALEAIIGWRERDWPKGFDRRTAEMFADYARALMSQGNESDV